MKVGKILVTGYGSIGNRHVNNLLQITNAKIIIYTKQQKVKSHFLVNLLNDEEKKARIEIVQSLDEAMKLNPDIGFITNETNLHVDTAIKLARNGIDLFIEKPLSNSMKKIKNLVDIINQKKLITQMGCNLRFFPPLKKIKQLVDDGVVGKIISVHVENGSYLPDWHPYEDYRNGYAARDELGGGIALTQIHEIDYLYWIFGNVKEVYSVSGKFSDLKVDSDDLLAGIIRFKNNVIAEVHLDYFQRPFFRSCKIKGTKGVIYWNSDDNNVKLYSNKKRKWKKCKVDNNYKLSSPKLNLMYIEEIRHFLKHVQSRSRTINDIKDGTETLKIVLAMKKASKLKKTIEI